MRKRYGQFTALLLACCFALTACGGGSSSEDVRNNQQGFNVDSEYAAGSSSSKGMSSSYAAMNSTYDYDDAADYESGEVSEGGTLDTGIIDTEKLVYSGEVTIATLEFDKAVETFQKMVKDYDGFLQSENISALDYYNNNTDEDSLADLAYQYSASVRIPSSSFNDFFAKTSEIGYVKETSTSVDNISQQYSTAQTSLEIYQTKYDRYIELLSKASTVEEMIEIERELTNLEIALAQYKTSLSQMDTDVAYSYVDVDIIEVRDESELARRDTFWQRLVETVKDSFKGVIKFAEWLLFFIIKYWWYFAFAAILIVIWNKLNNKFKFTEKHRLKKEANHHELMEKRRAASMNARAVDAKANADVKKAEVKPEEAKSEDDKGTEVKSSEDKVAESKPEEPKPIEDKADAEPADDSK